jgi:tetratricopeptide (TPR) repeat protein
VDPAVAMRRFFQERVEKAERAGRQRAQVFVSAAEEAVAKQDFVAAAAHYKLALGICDAPDLRAAFEAADTKAQGKRVAINVGLAEAAEREERWDEAIQRYTKALGVKAEPRVAERLANALRIKGDQPKLAVKHAEEAVLADPKNVAFRVTLAQCYAQAGLMVRALGEAERAVALDHKDERAKLLLGKLKAKR